MNSDRLERILELLMMIGNGRARKVDELAEHFNVTRRTVFRDLKTLNRVGVKTCYDHLERRYRAHGGTAFQPIGVTENECLALLFLSRKILEANIWPDVVAAKSAASKLEAMLPDEMRDRCAVALSHLDLKMAPFSSLDGSEKMFADLLRGLTRQERLCITYEPPGLPRVEDYLHPYHMAFMRDGWYVLGRSEVLDEVRAFKIERIFACSATGQRFVTKHSFDLSEYLGNAWGVERNDADEEYSVLLEFAPDSADSIEEVMWHKTQVTWRTESDSLMFEVHVTGLEDIALWILGHGEHVKVIQPAELQALIREKAHLTLAISENR